MKALRIFGNIFAVIFSGLFLIILLGFLLINFASGFLNGNVYTTILKNVDFTEIKLSDLGIEEFGEYFGDATIEEVLVGSLEEVGLDAKVAKELVNNEELKEVVGEFIGDTVNYAITQEEIPQIKTEDIKKIVNSEEISGVLEEVPSNQQIEEAIAELNVNLKEILNEEFNYAE